jgi:hypothetical protein
VAKSNTAVSTSKGFRIIVCWQCDLIDEFEKKSPKLTPNPLCLKIKATRLGEFSPMGRLFALASFL